MQVVTTNASLGIYRSVIVASRPDNDQSTNSTSGHCVTPSALAVAPTSGYLFWLDAGGNGVNAKVGRTNMDGSDTRTLVERGFSEYGHIIVDEEAQAIYFTQPAQGTVRKYRRGTYFN